VCFKHTNVGAVVCARRYTGDDPIRSAGETMSVKLRAIHLYSHHGQIRAVSFKASGLNIVTGQSKTGKSAIIDIIDYCLGRSRCYIAEGIIRERVSWFALEIENGDERLFIARKNPGSGVETGPDIFIRRGIFPDPPNISELQRNITLEALTRLATRFAGIAENENRPIFGTRRPLQATIRHALFFCFQKQDEIDNRDRLFHRQGEEFVPQAIKDTLPYFLGAVDQTHFLKHNELDTARGELRRLQDAAQQQIGSTTNRRTTIRRLLNEAKRVGLIPEEFEPVEEVQALNAFEQASKTSLAVASGTSNFGETIDRLKNEQRSVRELMLENFDEIRLARRFLSDQNSYTREATEQQGRLKSLELYKASDTNGEFCPLCENHLAVPTPQVAQLQKALSHIGKQLSATFSESPHIQAHLAALEERRLQLERDLVEVQNTLGKALADDARASALQDSLLERARVVGRISAFLETLRTAPDLDLSAQIDAAKLRVEVLEEQVSANEVSQRVDTFLNLISSQMTSYATRLRLEHSTGALRLDIKNLTVVSDTESGPIPLYRMGSGENWVGYHVLTYLALHWWFHRRNRPVPGFVIFDQPSQAHYPAERDQDGKLDPLKDDDRTAVRDLFKLMSDACLELGESFQLIVLDHAHLDDAWFEIGIIQEWRHGSALIPRDWPTGGSSNLS
jgi:hypothetical protein